jgi:hypothetical protein
LTSSSEVINAHIFFQVEEAKSEFRRRKLEQWRRRQKDATMTSEEFRAKKSKERRLKQVTKTESAFCSLK